MQLRYFISPLCTSRRRILKCSTSKWVFVVAYSLHRRYVWLNILDTWLAHQTSKTGRGRWWSPKVRSTRWWNVSNWATSCLTNHSELCKSVTNRVAARLSVTTFQFKDFWMLCKCMELSGTLSFQFSTYFWTTYTHLLQICINIFMCVYVFICNSVFFILCINGNHFVDLTFLMSSQSLASAALVVSMLHRLLTSARILISDDCCCVEKFAKIKTVLRKI